jgi:N utilization substance protein B
MSRAAADAFAARRNAARLAAVQALYQMEIGGRGAAAVVREFLDERLTEDGESRDELDAEHFRALVASVVEHQAHVDDAVAGVLAEGWRLDRLDATARAILRAGASEVLTRPDIPIAAVIDAYVDIAHAFFEGPEPGFVNAALDALAKRRGAERAPAP